MRRPTPTTPVPLKDSQEEAEIFRRRAIFSGVIVVIAFCVLVIRYGYLQIIQYETYQTQAESNRVKLQAIAPPRGYIYDRNGILLADNRPVFTAVMNLQDVMEIDDILRRITPIFQLSDEDISRIKNRIKIANRYDVITLKINLNEEDIARFAEVKFQFSGIDIEVKLARYYPYGELFAHALGYVGRISDKEVTQLDPSIYAGTDLIGKTFTIT